MEVKKQKDNTPSAENLEQTHENTLNEQNTVGSDGGGVGASHEAWGGELPPPVNEEFEQAETD